MEKNQNTPLFPIASWQIGFIPSLGIISFCPNFLTNLSQKPDEANQGRYYALTPLQAQALIQDLKAQVQKAENAEPLYSPNQKH